MPAVAAEGTWPHQYPLPSGPSPAAAENGHWAQKNRTRSSQAPFFIKTHSLIFHSLKSHSKIGKGAPPGVDGKGGCTNPAPGGGGATPHTAARLAQGGMRRAGWRPVGSGTDGTWGYGAGQPGVGGTLTSPGWRGLAPPGPSHCAARPVKAGHLWSRADEASPGPGGAGDLRARLGQCDTTHSCLSVVPEPGRSAGEGGGDRREGSRTCCQCQSPSVSRQCGNGGGQ